MNEQEWVDVAPNTENDWLDVPQGQAVPSANPAFLPGSNRIESEIAQRPDSMQVLQQEANTHWDPRQNPFKAAFHMPVQALKAVAVPFQRLEAAVANPALEVQKGNFNPISLTGEALKGASGQKSGQLGDLVRTTGFGGRANEVLATTAGMFGSMGLGNAGVGATAKVAGKGASKVQSMVNPTADQINIQIDKTINEGVRRGVRPSSTGARTRSAGVAAKLNTESNSAVRDIVKNKGSLKYETPDGELIEGGVPTNLNETAQAMNQRMKTLVEDWTTLAEDAGGEGAFIKNKPYINKLDDMLDDLSVDEKGKTLIGKKGEIFKTEHSTDYEKVKAIRDGLKLRGNMSPTEALNKIQEWNADLKGGYNSGFKYGSQRAQNVVKGLVESLRSDLDSVISSSTGEAFQPLRTQWGAYKSLIKDVIHRSDVSGRANPQSIWSFLDQAGNAEIIGGGVQALSGNPATGLTLMAKGAALKAGKRFIQKANDPNNIVRKMFSNVDKLMQKLPKEEIAPIATKRPGVVNPEVMGAPPKVQFSLNPFENGLMNQSDQSPLALPASEMKYGEGFTMKDVSREKITPDVKKAAQDKVNDIWAAGLGFKVSDTDKKAAVIGGATALGAGMFGQQAQASTIGQENNNPINIKAFDKWDGMTGKDKFGHAQFKDLDHGIRASIKNLRNHQKKHPDQTLKEYFNTFAEANGTPEAVYVAKKLGISPDAKLKDVNMEEVLIPLSKFESKIEISQKDIIRIKKKFKL